MIDFLEFEQNIKKGVTSNCYIFCGLDENIIKDSIRSIEKKVMSSDFKDFNYIQFDGSTINVQEIINACETLPFMTDKKMVVVYRASFLEDGKGKKSVKDEKVSESSGDTAGEETDEEAEESIVEESIKGSKDNSYKIISSYAENVPEHCILVMYYVFNNKRDKASAKLARLSKSKKICVVSAGKPRRDFIEKRAKTLFNEHGKEIGNTELRLFSQEIENKLNMMNNEIEKLCAYTEGRSITKEDIRIMLPPETDNDIFDFVDCLADKNIEKSMDIMNELIYKGQKIPVILKMIERQFNLLFNLKLGVGAGKGKEELAAKYKLHPFICGKMIEQCRKFSLSQLKGAIESCIDAEEKLKSSSVNANIEMELLIINCIIK